MSTWILPNWLVIDIIIIYLFFFYFSKCKHKMASFFSYTVFIVLPKTNQLAWRSSCDQSLINVCVTCWWNTSYVTAYAKLQKKNRSWNRSVVFHNVSNFALLLFLVDLFVSSESTLGLADDTSCYKLLLKTPPAWISFTLAQQNIPDPLVKY